MEPDVLNIWQHTSITKMAIAVVSVNYEALIPTLVMMSSRFN